MTNDEMVLQLKQGNHIVFKIIFESLYPSLLAYVTSFTHNQQEAKDIVQNSFIILWNGRKKLKEKSCLKNYMFRLAHNLFINEYRKEKFKNKVYTDLKLTALNARISEDKAIGDQRSQKLLELIDELPPRCKEILKLNKNDGLKYQEISVLLGISVKTVESQMRIAFKKIRSGFNQHKFILFLFLKKILKTKKAVSV